MTLMMFSNKFPKSHWIGQTDSPRALVEPETHVGLFKQAEKYLKPSQCSHSSGSQQMN